MGIHDSLVVFASELENALGRFDDSERIANDLDEREIDSYFLREASDHIRCQRLTMLELQRKFTNVLMEIGGMPKPSLITDTPIRNLDITIRTQNILLENGVKNLGDLLQTYFIDFLKMPRLGKKSYAEIERLANRYGGLNKTCRH